MWHAYIASLLTKAALPIIGAAIAVVLSLSAALWWTSGRLSDARDKLALSRQDTLTCIAANDSLEQAIEALEQAQAQNQAQIEDLRRREQDAIGRITELEAERNERTTDTIERVIRIADGDACAGLPISDSLRDAASGDRDTDSRGRG
jgi:hypothetical protein